MNPINKILGKDVSKDRGTSDMSVPKWWSKHQQQRHDYEQTVQGGEQSPPPKAVILAAIRKKRMKQAERDEEIERINSRFRVEKDRHIHQYILVYGSKRCKVCNHQPRQKSKYGLWH